MLVHVLEDRLRIVANQNIPSTVSWTEAKNYLEEHDSVKHVWLLEGAETIGESLEVQGIPTTIQHHMYPYRPLQGISNHEVNFIWNQP